MHLRIQSKLSSLIIAICLIQSSSRAQNESYHGSIADGNAKGEIFLFTPSASITMHAPYIGTGGDGHSTFYLNNYDANNTPAIIASPYQGSVGDGFSSNFLFDFNPSNVPLVFSPYYGGESDGWAKMIHYTTYTFIGNGNWEDSVNWYKNELPPSILPPGEIILINPPAEGVCILHTAQTISPGSKLIIKPGRTLVVDGRLIQQ